MSSLFKLNWIDIIAITLLIRITYIGLRRGFIIELFKVLGIFLSLFVTLHYYSKLAGFISERTPLSLNFSEPFVFLILVTLMVLVFKFIRDGLLFLFKIEPKSALDKSGGAVFGLIRVILIMSLMLLTFTLIQIDYLKNSIPNSLTGTHLIKVGPQVYKFTFDKFIHRFFPGEELNKAIWERLDKLKPEG